MPVGNLVRALAREGAARRLGDYSPVALTQVGSLLDSVTRKINDSQASLMRQVPGSALQLGEATFGKKFRELVRGSSKGPTLSQKDVTGNVADGSIFPEQYRVLITNSTTWNFEITALLQEALTFQVTSEWESIVQQSDVPIVGEILAQLAFRKALASTHMSRRIWRGTSPLAMTLNLKFQAVNNAWKEVVAPTMQLQQLALPSEGGVFGQDLVKVLSPPGPSPFKVTVPANLLGQGNDARELSAGDKIQIQIGNLWTFPSVVIKDVTVTYPTKYTAEGHPLSADVVVIFETYEIITKSGLESAYGLGKTNG